MTEKQWIKCKKPQEMVEFLCEHHNSPRKLRLFGCACCRQIWDLITDKRFHKAVETAEQYADGEPSGKQLAKVKKECGWALHEADEEGISGPPYCAMSSAWSTTRNPEAAAMYPLWVFDQKHEIAWQITLLQDIFGNPFRPFSIDPSWLTSNVMALAKTIYNERRFEEMPILADALEEAGCTNDNLLSHCREDGLHARGCWVVDGLLKKD